MLVNLVESAWEAPHDFCPERWYSRQDMIKDKRAFAPFGVGKGFFHPNSRYELNIPSGKTSCVGKNLALTEIRMAVAGILSVFNMSFLPGDDGAAVERDMRDQLTAYPGDLKLIFTQRSRPKNNAC